MCAAPNTDAFDVQAFLDSPGIAKAVVAASIVATVAFWAYTRTLLPGVDLGDTGDGETAETLASEQQRLVVALGALVF